MKCSIFKFVFVFFLIFLLFQTTKSQSDTISDQWEPNISSQIKSYKSSFVVGLSDEDRQKMKSLWNEIGEDLKTEQNAAAGTYVNLGYYNGYFLRWTIDKGFILISYYDQDYIQDFSYGTVNFIDNSEIIFSPQRELSNGRPFKKLPRKWTVLGRRLIPIENLKDFGLFQAGLGEYNDFNGDCCEFTPSFTNHKMEGDLSLSVIPEKYKRFLVKPISGKIISVGKKKVVNEWSYEGKLYSRWMDKTALVPVKINVGRKQGVKKNMLFSIIDGLEYENIQYVQIIKVYENTSQGFVVREFTYEGKEVYFDYVDDKEKPFPPIKIGTKISTNKN